MFGVAILRLLSNQKIPSGTTSITLDRASGELGIDDGDLVVEVVIIN
jgi:hypothetical protein